MSSTLFPGYKLVSAFSTDEHAYESEEEVSYVTLDLGPVEPMLVPSTSEYRLIVSFTVHAASEFFLIPFGFRDWILQRHFYS